MESGNRDELLSQEEGYYHRLNSCLKVKVASNKEENRCLTNFRHLEVKKKHKTTKCMKISFL